MRPRLLTLEDLLDQIIELQAKVAELQAQIDVLKGATLQAPVANTGETI